MRNVVLTEPSIQYENEYLDMLKDWESTGEKLVPFTIKMDPSDFASMVSELNGYCEGIGVENFVPHSTFWLTDAGGRVLGAVNIRHRLNEKLLQIGGHIGYGIRPSERRKGLATQALKLALDKAKELGLCRVLLTCDKANIGSAQTIIRNGGKLENEFPDGDRITQRYWIDIPLR